MPWSYTTPALTIWDCHTEEDAADANQVVAILHSYLLPTVTTSVISMTLPDAKLLASERIAGLDGDIQH